MKIVVATIGSYGDVNPYLALGQGLKARHHEVVLATSEYYRADAERCGLGFAPLRPNVEFTDRKLFQRLMHARRGPEVVIRELVMPAVKDMYVDLEKAAHGADLLISHVLTYAAPVFAEKFGIKWISTILSPLVFFSAYDPPVLSPAPWLATLRSLGPAVNSVVLRTLKRISYRWAEPVRKLRRELGLGPGEDPLFEGQHSPHRVLGLFSHLLAEKQPDWPASTQICGFLFHDENIGGRTIDPRLESFLKNGSAPIVFTLGSSAVMAAGNFYGVAIEATRSLKRRAVLLAGNEADTLAASSLPDEIMAVHSAPYHWIFPQGAAIVHQGGVGTTGQAMRSGKPMVVMPFAHDQHDNAARVEHLGIGKTFSRNRLTPRTLTESLDQLLNDPEIQNKAAAVGRSIRAENGLNEACDAIALIY